MALRLYNTLTKQEEDFVPADPKRVTMYTCGPTVYSRPHVGNYASFLMADLLRRWMEAGHGWTVEHAKNITDVGHLLHDADSGDDKIQREAEKQKMHPLEIAKKYTDEYLEDEKTLNFIEPEHRPRATEFIMQMKEMTEALLQSDHAYATDDGIYFDVTSKTPTPYGTLSGNLLDQIKAGARVDVKEGKKHPADFALWKFCVGDNAHHVLRWPSPVGPAGETYPEGFPGWHIECSAMSRALLGDQIDIHTGGEDNIFPHHECEIAQSECTTGKKPFVRLWLHRRRINLEGEKMSKSLGNVLSITDIIAKGYDAMDIRYYLLSVHYRTHLAFSEKGLDDARKARRKIVEWMVEMEEEIQSGSRIDSRPASLVTDAADWLDDYCKIFATHMNTDLNAAGALAAVFEAMAPTRLYIEKAGGLTENDAQQLREWISMIRHTFGCFDATEEAIPAHIQALVEQREQARASKNFAESDRLRDAIDAQGYEVRDVKGAAPEIRKK